MPAVWVGLEYVRCHFPTGFPFLAAWCQYQSFGFGWYQLGHAFHRVLPLIQVADVGGVYLLSVGVAAVNAAAWMWAERSNRVRRLLRKPPRTDRTTPLGELWATAAALSLPAAFVAYGTVRLDHPAFRVGPRVALLQGSVPQDLKSIDGGPSRANLPPLVVEYNRAGRPGRKRWASGRRPPTWWCGRRPAVGVRTGPESVGTVCPTRRSSRTSSGGAAWSRGARSAGRRTGPHPGVTA